MARQSKKEVIATAAFAILLEQGVKAMSIDSVVKASGVSKPTIYNHFADKAQLVNYVLEDWLSKVALPTFSNQEAELKKQLEAHWSNFDVVRLYSIFIGEGDRCPEARRLFFSEYHGKLLAALQKTSLAERAQTCLHDWLMQQFLNI